VALSGSELQTADANGDFDHYFYCDNTCGNSGDDAITVTVDLCGDGTCAAFEDCLNCPADCGECPDTWWQIWGGHLFGGLESGTAIASNVPADTVCVEPGCSPYLSALDRLGTTDSDGFAFTGGGGIDANGQISARTENTFALGSAQTRFKEKYAYFARQYSLGLDPEEDFAGQESDAQQPVYDGNGDGEADQAYYYRGGDMTIQSVWDVASDESYVIFVDGNLTFSDPGDVGQLVQVAEDGFLAFIVAGDITIDETVGHETRDMRFPLFCGPIRFCVRKNGENSFRIELEKDIQCWNEDDGGFIILQ
jgi:hypothetical protein